MSVAAREHVRPDFPAVVHTYTDVLRELLRTGPRDAGTLASVTGRVKSNLVRDAHKLAAAEVIEIVPHADGPAYHLTDKGRRWLRGMDVADGAPVDARSTGEAPLSVDPRDLRENPLNPRRRFDAVEIAELADSIAEEGLLQPVGVYPAQADGARTLWAGERRRRALLALLEAGRRWPGFPHVPAIEREADPALAPVLALIENGRRADLQPIERARAYAALADGQGWSASEIARRTGASPRPVQEDLKVLREAGEALLAAHEAGALTWEQLRYAVRDGMNDARKAELARRAAGGGPVNSGGGARQVPPLHGEGDSPPAGGERGGAEAPPPAPLAPPQALALAELSHKIEGAPAPESDGYPPRSTVLGDFWRSANHQALIAAGLIERRPVPGRRFVALITPAGRDALTAHLSRGITSGFVRGPNVTDADLQRLAAEAHATRDLDDPAVYVTRWLNDAPPPPAPAEAPTTFRDQLRQVIAEDAADAPPEFTAPATSTTPEAARAETLYEALAGLLDGALLRSPSLDLGAPEEAADRLILSLATGDGPAAALQLAMLQADTGPSSAEVRAAFHRFGQALAVELATSARAATGS